MSRLNLLQAQQARRVFELFAAQITDESVMMEVADMYPTWEQLVEKKGSYKAGTVFRWGVNDDGETQLWSFISDYTPVDTYTPEQDIAHYKKIGITESGVPIWSQPLGATDAYSKGDKVSHRDVLWTSDVDGNVWEPGVYGWSQAAE